MRILVTGAAGFIGSHLVDALIESGHTVFGIDDFLTGQKENINPKSEFKELDITEKYSTPGYIRRVRPDYIFHLAAMARISDCLKRPEESHNINVTATLRLLEVAKEIHSAFVFSSSSAVYGETEKGQPIKETHRLQPISLYGLHKLTSEQYTLMYNKFFGVRAAALRYFNVYGTARQNPAGAYPNVFSSFGKSSKEGLITIYGDGYVERDFVHVYDVVKANMSFIGAEENAWGQAYNIGTGFTHTINDVAAYFPVKREYKEARLGDPSYSCADTSKARDILGWQSQINFHDGVNIFLKSLEEKNAQQS